MNNKKDKQSGGAIQKMLGGMDMTTIGIISGVILVVLIVILGYTKVIDFSFITNMFSSTENTTITENTVTEPLVKSPTVAPTSVPSATTTDSYKPPVNEFSNSGGRK